MKCNALQEGERTREREVSPSVRYACVQLQFSENERPICFRPDDVSISVLIILGEVFELIFRMKSMLDALEGEDIRAISLIITNNDRMAKRYFADQLEMLAKGRRSLMSLVVGVPRPYLFFNRTLGQSLDISLITPMISEKIPLNSQLIDKSCRFRCSFPCALIDNNNNNADDVSTAECK